MPLQNERPLIHSNRYSADSACWHCDGVLCHELWCITQNAHVQYAYQVVGDPVHMECGDHLILHALGARWTAPGPLRKTLPPNTIGKQSAECGGEADKYPRKSAIRGNPQ